MTFGKLHLSNRPLVAIHFVIEVAFQQMRMGAVHVVKLFVVAAFETKALISVPAEIVAFNALAWKQEEKKIG